METAARPSASATRMAAATMRSGVRASDSAGSGPRPGCAVADVSATTVPTPGTGATRPSCRSVGSTLVAVAIATPQLAGRCSRVDGTRSPGASSPGLDPRRSSATIRA